ncbi:polysaccharide biosynthesis protein [Thiohalophilus thiocyanatoxydans]|uniref:Polysaccharide biosynthesis protein n=2 Tax=Thiohalophilus thiocyanatoxydans TaxID=381308 RepID=A0A4R8IXP0_9GAMM|nr:polysaccharide biosynthesis protein [Thiohalophilus thiocyanatoxydans]
MIESMISTNSRIVVTGACGSVGSELVRRLLSLGHTVCALDQSEDGLFRLDQELNEIAEGRLRSFLGNIRDEYRLRMAFEGVDIVFHCAALKHVYLSEYNPFEAMQTNIEGSHNVIQAAIAADVDRVIFTSSDKAVNPTSTMGASKLLGERLFVSANHHAGKHKTRFSCVRFGNVLNSNGSVLTIFKRQLENGSPITITSKQMTRFFITMEQAVDLCLYAASEMLGGEIFVLNMGSNDIMTLARVVSGDESPEFIEIGVKPGEKLYEELVTENEAPRTVYDDHVYVVLPDTVDLMSDETRHEYSKYNDFPRLNAPLRSDQDLLTEEEVANILSFSSLI